MTLRKKRRVQQDNHKSTAAFNAGIVMILCAALMTAAPGAQQNAGDDGTDRSIKPGDDFYRYANGGWLRTAVIPAGQDSYDNRTMMRNESAERVRLLLREAASAHSPKGTISQKVGDYYASVIDEAAIKGKGLTPLADQMAAISAISDQRSLSSYLGSTLNSEVEGLIANADHVFGIWINQGFEDSDHNLPHLWQGGLGLPDRNIYLGESPKTADLRTKYQAHVAGVLKVAGFADTESRAATVLSLETKIAHAFAPDSDAADVSKQNNPWKRGDFAIKAPGILWPAFFESAGLSRQEDFVVWQPSAVIGVSALVTGEPLEEWKDYLRFHLIEHYSVVLPSIAAEGSAATSTGKPGEPPLPNREDTAIASTNGALGQAVGQLYVQRYFPPEAKAKAQAMAHDLKTTWSTHIANLAWMSPQAKEKALAKLAALEIGVGYPDHWIDYGVLDIERGDAFGNMRRAEAFIRQRNLDQLKRSVDPIEWPINPQTPGAVIMFSPNVEVFSAAILQPPYFEANGDSASNYGSAGAGMAHEIGHSFDELGNIYDAHGRLHGWWTAEDRARYKATASKLSAQFDRNCPLPDICVKGQQVLGESVNDLAGLVVAHDAYLLSLKGKSDVVVGGLTGEQRFFLSFARRWRKIQTDASLRSQIATDTHAPAKYRADIVRNVDAWYEAYRAAAGDQLYLKPADRVTIW